MDFDVTKYLPALDEIPLDKIAEVQTRLRVQSLNAHPDTKTTANSPFGNLFINPAANIIAQYEIAQSNFQGDLILENLAAGNVTNCDFVRDYLANYGVVAGKGVPVIGVVRLVFNENKTYLIDRGSQMAFGDNGLFHFILPQLGDLHIDPVGYSRKLGNWYALTQVAPGEYVVNIPVIGTPGSVVVEGEEARTDIPDPELVRIEAINDFDTGRMPDDIAKLAQMAIEIFYAANFADRGGSIAFIKRKLPNAVGVSAIKAGDVEMQRDKNSILLTSKGAMDVCIKTRIDLVKDTCILPLSLAFDRKLVGALDLPGGVVLYVDSINNVETGEAVDAYSLYGTSRNNVRAQFASSAFSNLEILGLEVDSSTIPVAGAEFTVSRNALAGVYPRIDTDSTGGIYQGHLFSSNTEHNVLIRPTGIIDVEGTTYGICQIEDLVSGDIIDGVLVTKIGNRGKIEFQVNEVKVEHLLNGLVIQFLTEADDFILTDANSFLGGEFEMYYSAPTANVEVKYRYDPGVQLVSTFLRSSEVQPVIDVLAKGFQTVYVSEFTVEYRRIVGKTVSKQRIRDEVFNYINSLTGPDLYEETQITDIVLFAGASGLVSVTFDGRVFHSLASQWSLDGRDNKDELVDLLDDRLIAFNDLYEEPELYSVVGTLNVNYILDAENIILKEVQS